MQGLIDEVYTTKQVSMVDESDNGPAADPSEEDLLGADASVDDEEYWPNDDFDPSADLGIGGLGHSDDY